jgi:hypothetical protein
MNELIAYDTNDMMAQIEISKARGYSSLLPEKNNHAN